MEVAARLFRERGYDVTSMQDIADEMGILKGSVYHYVRTKEDLLWMVVAPPLRELVDQATVVLNAPGRSVEERLRDAIHAHARSFETHYPHMFVIIRENGETLSPKRRREFDAMRDEYMSLWLQTISGGVHSGELRGDLDARLAVHAVFGMLNWMFRWFTLGRRLTPDAVAEEFAGIFMRGILSE